MERNKIGQFIKIFRRSEKITARQFLEKFDFKWSECYQIQIENSNMLPTPEIAIKIAVAIGFEPESFLHFLLIEKMDKYKEKLNKKYVKIRN